MIFVKKGDSPLSDQQLHDRCQSIINSDWPQWKREKAMRSGGVLLDKFNTYMDQWSIDQDLNRENNFFNFDLENYKKAINRLNQVELSVGRNEVVQKDEDGNDVIISESIKPIERYITVDGEKQLNPIVYFDEQQRLDASGVVSITPQDVIDFYEAK